jgi:hypothetical protein
MVTQITRSNPRRNTNVGKILMSANTKSEDRLLDASELQMVSATRPRAIERLTMAQLKALVHRLRQAHGRAKDISARQQREMRGKAGPRGTKRVRDNTGSKAKVQVLFEAVRRADAELSRREKNQTGTPNQAELSRRALELKLSGQSKQHPSGGRTASQGIRPKARKKPTKVGTTRREIGRVSQAGKVAQARKDARKG